MHRNGPDSAALCGLRRAARFNWNLTGVDPQAIDAHFKRIELDEATLQESLNLRRTHRLKLPDAMIWASARVNGWQLVTRNTKDFPPEWAGIRLPYVI